MQTVELAAVVTVEAQDQSPPRWVRQLLRAAVPHSPSPSQTWPDLTPLLQLILT